MRATAEATTVISTVSIYAPATDGVVIPGRKARSLRLFVNTDTLDSDIAALAITGESSHPVSG